MTQRIKHWLFAVFTSAVVAALVGVVVVPAAYAHRGYTAYGGEWLLILLTFVGVLWCVTGKDVQDV